ncbi:hypothetical protein BDV12DRAFT_203383 [Aspergillus spectabilis]
MESQECTEIDEDGLDMGMGEGEDQEHLAREAEEEIEQGCPAREEAEGAREGEAMELEYTVIEAGERIGHEQLQREVAQEAEQGPACHNQEAAAEEIKGLLHEMLQENAESGTTIQNKGTQDQVMQERADALDQLQSNLEPIPLSQGTVDGHEVSRPVTELPVDLPSLIAQWRGRESQRLEGNTTQPRRSRLQTSRPRPQPVGIRESRMKERLTHQDINRAGTLDGAISDELGKVVEEDTGDFSQAADSHGIVPEIVIHPVAEPLQEERVAQERADALSRLQTPVTVEDHDASRPMTEPPIDLPNLIAQWRERGSQRLDENTPPSHRSRLRTERPRSKSRGIRRLRMEKRLTLQSHGRVGSNSGNIAGAGNIKPSQEDTKQYTADLLDPDQAQREAVQRQEAEDSLFEETEPEEMEEDQDMGEDQDTEKDQDTEEDQDMVEGLSEHQSL